MNYVANQQYEDNNEKVYKDSLPGFKLLLYIFARKPLVAANIGIGVFTMVTNSTEWVLIVNKNIKESVIFNIPIE